MKNDFPDFKEDIVSIVGSTNFLYKEKDIFSYCQGIRVGKGSASSVILPRSLLEFWEILNFCVKYNKIIIIQAANTGLTGGSTPYGNDYDRDIVIINTLNINQIILLNNGLQVIAFPGATLYKLDDKLSKLGRTPHSIIGSSCIGASVIGGICNNSGGNLVNRGPAYTELSLFVRLDSQMKLQLVNHLGIELGDSPEEIITNLQNVNFDPDRIKDSNNLASDTEYKQRVRDISSVAPARFNADKRRLYESSGCAGKLAVLAVRLDTFSKPKEEKVFFLGTNNPSVLTDIRKAILTKTKTLPDMGEYMHRSYFDGADKYCKDTFSLIKYFGTSSLPKLLRIKRKVDFLSSKFTFLPSGISDKSLQCFSKLIPDHLPKRVRDYRKRFEHYLLIQASDQSINEIDLLLKNQVVNNQEMEFFKCTESEGKDILLHRYVAGSAPMRYAIINSAESGELLPLDVALPRNCETWFQIFPKEITDQMEEFFQMGHFLCMVFHWDFVVKKGVDVLKLKKEILAILDENHAKYPAEHNVGHIYEADDNLRAFYMQLDPTNSFNSGIGKTSKNVNYG